jgi:hypothetical protein
MQRKQVAIAFAVFGLSLASGQAAAWSPWTHWDQTTATLAGLGWQNQEAIDVVTDCNIATDGAWSSLVREAFPQSENYVDLVLLYADTFPPNQAMTDGFHFDDLFTYDAIAARWAALEAWRQDLVASTILVDRCESGMPVGFLCAMGMVLHAVQDFYCHSNWIALTNRFTMDASFAANELPTWEQFSDAAWLSDHPGFDPANGATSLAYSNVYTSTDDQRGGLQTGAWDVDTFALNKFKIPVEPWGHRHPGGDEGHAGVWVGVHASWEWVDRMMMQAAEICRNAKGGPNPIEVLVRTASDVSEPAIGDGEFYVPRFHDDDTCHRDSDVYDGGFDSAFSSTVELSV